MPAKWWWWERVVLGLLLLTTVVLTRSYAGNLMSLLAVRHIPQPYLTLSDIIADPAATLIWLKGSSIERYIEVKEKLPVWRFMTFCTQKAVLDL